MFFPFLFETYKYFSFSNNLCHHNMYIKYCWMLIFTFLPRECTIHRNIWSLHILLFTLKAVKFKAERMHAHFPGKNTGVGCHFLLQGIFLTHGSNPQIKPMSPRSLALAVPSGKPIKFKRSWQIHNVNYPPSRCNTE